MPSGSLGMYELTNQRRVGEAVGLPQTGASDGGYSV